MKQVRLISAMGQQGFSLIELMIVVAIIAILSAIAIPNFERDEEQARQTEGATLLAGYYTAQHNAFAEYSKYPGNFVAAGYQPDGAVNYHVEALDNNTTTTTDWNPAPNPNDANCVSTAATTCNWGGGVTAVNFHETSYAAGTPANCGPAVSNTTFVACASSFIDGTTNADTFSIDQANDLDHGVASGLMPSGDSGLNAL